MATLLASCFNFSLLILILFYLGCFIFISNSKTKSPRKRKSQSQSHNHLHSFSLSSSWAFLKRFFSNNSSSPSPAYQTTSSSSPRSSHHSLVTPILDSDPPRKRRAGSRSELPFFTDSVLSQMPVLPLRNEIIPCPLCGEIFQTPNLLEHHQASKHAVSELYDGDSGKNVVLIIFKTGWGENAKTPNIHRILKIHNSPKILSRFEDYRETVKARAARGANAPRDERCVADGNELLRFHCTTLACNLGQNGNSSVCGNHYCSACGVIRAGFSPKLDGISTLSNSWRAHVSIPDDVETEFAFMNVKRVMLVCRVVAGRVGCDPMLVTEEGKEDPGFDSLMGRVGSDPGGVDDEELLVFNSRAVLPCFLIVYSV